jgi:spore germination protein GerM
MNKKSIILILSLIVVVVGYLTFCFKESQDTEKTMTILVYFGNKNLNPQSLCEEVFPVRKIVSFDRGSARVAIEELLKGPSEKEILEGYFTSINSGVNLQKISIEGNVARVDFDETLESGVGGSCRVVAINKQIEETLKQFPSVREVIVSIDGRTEDMLQP